MFTLPLLDQKMVYVEPLGIWVEPKKSRVDREKIFNILPFGEISLSDKISEDSFEEQCKYVAIDDVINNLLCSEVNEYAQRNGKRLLKRGEWYVSKLFMESKGIKNDMCTGQWEITGSLVDYTDSGVISRDPSLYLPQRGGYIQTTDENGFPLKVQTEAEPVGPVLKPYYLLNIGKGETGVIVCAGDLKWEKELPLLRELSLLVIPLLYRHPFISFRLCYDSAPAK